MINRYEYEPIAEIWSKKFQFNLWKQIELTYLKEIMPRLCVEKDHSLYLNTFAYEPDVKEIQEIEKTTKHEVVAFLKHLSDAFNNEDCKKYLHFGLTSSDIIDTASTLQFKLSLNILKDLTSKLLTAIDHVDTSYGLLKGLGRTHGKAAEEIYWTSRFTNLALEIDYCMQELESSIVSLPGKLSGPVGTSSLVDLDAVSATLKAFNLSPSPYKSQIIPRHLYAKPVWALSLLMSCYEKFATLVRLSAIDEVNEAQERFTRGQTGSSAMPHKNNPVTSENICGLSRLSRSYVNITLENINLWWERDISHSSTERVVWPDAFHLACTATAKMTSLINGLRINITQIEQNLERSKVTESHVELLKKSIETNRFEAYEEVQEEYF